MAVRQEQARIAEEKRKEEEERRRKEDEERANDMMYDLNIYFSCINGGATVNVRLRPPGALNPSL